MGSYPAVEKKQPNLIYALVCSGGGVIGAYQVGVLKYIHEFFCRGEQSPFQIFTGISCGSLNTTFYAFESFQARQSRLLLEKLWLKFHVPQYQQDVLRALLGFFLKLPGRKRRKRFWSLLDPQPMLDIIDEGLNRSRLERAFETGSTLGVAVAATEMISSTPCWFCEGPRAVEWKRFHSFGFKDSICREHVAASCSVPFYLPPVRIREHYFVDGNVNLERPFSAAISMGASRILGISTAPPRWLELPEYRKHFSPKFSTFVRLMYKCFSRDFSFSETEQVRVLNRFAAHIKKRWSPFRRIPEKENAVFDASYLPKDYRPIEIYLIHPSLSSEGLFHRFRNTQSGSGKKWVHGNFVFHRDFIKALIDMGYEDAKTRHGELERFFSQ